ncbi:MAG: M56 family metallopeptidase [Bdellovibrionota bacterium]
MPAKHQMFQLGIGLSHWSVYLNGVFSTTGLDGKIYNASIGDYLIFWIQRKYGTEVPLIILSAVLAISATLAVIRIVHGFRFERKRRLDRLGRQSLRKITLKFRSVDIYISDKFSGTPFTGGVLKPYICLPQDAVANLSTEEIEAVIAHELGHVRNFDLVTTILIQMLGDVFWFVPFYRWLSRKIDRLREVVADQSAVKSGIDPTHLASALVKLKEIPDSNDKFVLYSAFFRERSLLKERVERLLGKSNEKQSRFGWHNIWVKSFVSLAIAGAVINSAFGGNNSTGAFQNPEWFTRLMQSLGL